MLRYFEFVPCSHACITRSHMRCPGYVEECEKPQGPPLNKQLGHVPHAKKWEEITNIDSANLSGKQHCSYCAHYTWGQQCRTLPIAPPKHFTCIGWRATSKTDVQDSCYCCVSAWGHINMQGSTRPTHSQLHYCGPTVIGK